MFKVTEKQSTHDASAAAGGIDASTSSVMLDPKFELMLDDFRSQFSRSVTNFYNEYEKALDDMPNFLQRMEENARRAAMKSAGGTIAKGAGAAAAAAGASALAPGNSQATNTGEALGGMAAGTLSDVIFIKYYRHKDKKRKHKADQAEHKMSALQGVADSVSETAPSIADKIKRFLGIGAKMRAELNIQTFVDACLDFIIPHLLLVFDEIYHYAPNPQKDVRLLSAFFADAADTLLLAGEVPTQGNISEWIRKNLIPADEKAIFFHKKVKVLSLQRKLDYTIDGNSVTIMGLLKRAPVLLNNGQLMRPQYDQRDEKYPPLLIPELSKAPYLESAYPLLKIKTFETYCSESIFDNAHLLEINNFSEKFSDAIKAPEQYDADAQAISVKLKITTNKNYFLRARQKRARLCDLVQSENSKLLSEKNLPKIELQLKKYLVYLFLYLNELAKPFAESGLGLLTGFQYMALKNDLLWVAALSRELFDLKQNRKAEVSFKKKAARKMKGAAAAATPSKWKSIKQKPATLQFASTVLFNRLLSVVIPHYIGITNHPYVKGVARSQDIVIQDNVDKTEQNVNFSLYQVKREVLREQISRYVALRESNSSHGGAAGAAAAAVDTGAKARLFTDVDHTIQAILPITQKPIDWINPALIRGEFDVLEGAVYSLTDRIKYLINIAIVQNDCGLMGSIFDAFELNCLTCPNDDGVADEHKTQHTILHETAARGGLTLIKYLVNLTETYEESINIRELLSKDGSSLLHSASNNSNVDVIRYLISECGFDVNQKSGMANAGHGQRSPLHMATQTLSVNHWEILQELMDNDNNCQMLDSEGSSAFYLLLSSKNSSLQVCAASADSPMLNSAIAPLNYGPRSDENLLLTLCKRKLSPLLRDYLQKTNSIYLSMARYCNEGRAVRAITQILATTPGVKKDLYKIPSLETIEGSMQSIFVGPFTTSKQSFLSAEHAQQLFQVYKFVCGYTQDVSASDDALVQLCQYLKAEFHALRDLGSALVKDMEQIKAIFDSVLGHLLSISDEPTVDSQVTLLQKINVLFSSTSKTLVKPDPAAVDFLARLSTSMQVLRGYSHSSLGEMVEAGSAAAAAAAGAGETQIDGVGIDLINAIGIDLINAIDVVSIMYQIVKQQFGDGEIDREQATQAELVRLGK